MRLDKNLTAGELFVFFLLAMLFYVYPIIQADYSFFDDQWRSLLLADDAWRTQGRILNEIMHKALAFTNGTINIFPLPLFISTTALALASAFFKVVVAPASNYAACFSNASSRSGFNITVPIGSQLRV